MMMNHCGAAIQVWKSEEDWKRVQFTATEKDWNVPGLVICSIAIENGPVEIVDFPIKHGGSFHRFLYVYRAGYFLSHL